MMVFTHLMVGAAVGRASGSTVAAFAAGMVSHLLLDRLPHRDTGMRNELLAALAALSLAGGWLRNDDRVLAGAAGAVLPDLENALNRMGLVADGGMAFPTHRGRASHGRETRSVWPQLILAAGAALYLYRRSR